MSAVDLLYRKWLHICLLLWSSEWIPLCALHPHVAFAFLIKLPLSQPTSFSILFSTHVLLRKRNEEQLYGGLAVRQGQPTTRAYIVLPGFLSCFVIVFAGIVKSVKKFYAIWMWFGFWSSNWDGFPNLLTLTFCSLEIKTIIPWGAIPNSVNLKTVCCRSQNKLRFTRLSD